MPDFEVLGWKKHPLDGDLAKSIRKDLRLHRREKGRGGHRFRFTTLKSLWCADGIQAVLNHKDDPAWQFWYHDARQGWLLISWHMTRREAQAAAEMPLPDLSPKSEPLTSGIYVIAGWPREGIDADYTMKVYCHSDSIADDLVAVFTKIGCVTTKTLLSA